MLDSVKKFDLLHSAPRELFFYEKLGDVYDVRVRHGKLTQILAGGTIFIEAKDSSLNEEQRDYHHIRIQYHGGKKCWMLEDERVNPHILFPRNDAFGTLTEMMNVFYDRTGIAPPDVKITDIGWGVSIVGMRGVRQLPSNPYQLTPGATYEITRKGRAERWVVARQVGFEHQTEVSREGSESHEAFSPRVIFDGVELLSLKRINGANLTEWQESPLGWVKAYEGSDFSEEKNLVAVLPFDESLPARVRVSPYNPYSDAGSWEASLSGENRVTWAAIRLDALGHYSPESDAPMEFGLAERQRGPRA